MTEHRKKKIRRRFRTLRNVAVLDLSVGLGREVLFSDYFIKLNKSRKLDLLHKFIDDLTMECFIIDKEASL